jgi:predicted ATPase
MIRIHSSWLLACLGHLDQALLQSDAALDDARRLSHPPTLAIAVGCAWTTEAFVRFEPQSLLPHADEELALATEHGLGFMRGWALIHRGWCLAAMGRAAEGMPLTTAGLAGIDELGFVGIRPWLLSYLADACRMAGQLQLALGHLDEAQRNADQTQQLMYQATTLRLRGDVLLAMGEPAGAEAGYREAIALARRQSAKLWELGAAMSLARLRRDQGRRAEAHALLAPVYGWFTEGFGTPVLREAKALLDELADTPTLPSEVPEAGADGG